MLWYLVMPSKSMIKVYSLLLLILAPSYCSWQVIQSLLVTYKMMQLHAFHNSGNSQCFIIEIPSSFYTRSVQGVCTITSVPSLRTYSCGEGESSHSHVYEWYINLVCYCVCFIRTNKTDFKQRKLSLEEWLKINSCRINRNGLYC